MESKGFNFFVGLFVVAGIAGIFVIGLWLARVDTTEKTLPYEILFEESVSGLSLGSRVSYRGIRIGSVSYIGIKEDNPQYVVVRITIKDDYPIHEGDVASLKLEGITGTSYIDIEGAERGSDVLQTSFDQPGLIPSRKSELEQLVQGIPELISEGTMLAHRFSEMLNQENRDQLTSILANVNEITAALVEQSDNLGSVLTTVNETGDELIRLSQSLREVTVKLDTLVDATGETVGHVDKLITEDGTQLVKQWQDTAHSLRQLTESAQTVLNDNQDSLQHFSREGLYEFTLFLQEARLLVAGLTRVVDRLESSGARFLLDQHNPEIDPN